MAAFVTPSAFAPVRPPDPRVVPDQDVLLVARLDGGAFLTFDHLKVASSLFSSVVYLGHEIT